MSKWEVIQGDCLDVLRGMADNSIDAVVSDPPYGLAFMGKRWDYDVPSVEVWAECLRVLKPGGHLLAFAGTRTQHRMAIRIEDAGFEIRDMIAWVYGSGFPKSHNLDGDWSGWGTALKPALEPITMARKPFASTVAASVQEWGTGAINVDGCRVGTESVTINTWDDGAKPFGGGAGHAYTGREVSGRWPANLIHDGSDEVVGLFPNTKSGVVKPYERDKSTINVDFNQGVSHSTGTFDYGDSGSAARFFYVAKASKAERDAGCEELDARPRPTMGSGIGGQPDQQRPNNRNVHPTVKPAALMAYLCRLVTPPGGIVLDPFTGSGSTGIAAIREGFNFVGIEREAEYVEIARKRIGHEAAKAPIYSEAAQ